MINIREIIRRLLKYVILVLICGTSIYIIPKNKVSNMEIIYISLIVGMVFCILDIITPSIKINVNNDNEIEINYDSEHLTIENKDKK